MSITRPHLYCPRLIDHIYQDTNGVYHTCCHGNDIEKSEGQLPFEHYHSEFMTNMRNAMFDLDWETFRKGCYKCIEQEAQNIKSHRHYAEGKNYEKQLEQIYQYQKVEPNPRSIRLKISPFGNHCNLSCSMCHPLNSHKRQQELDGMDGWGALFERNHNPQLLDYKDIAEDIINHADLIDSIDILGGEPIIHKNHKPFIEMLMDSGKCQHFQIIYTSNCTRLKAKEKLLYQVFDYFRSVRIRLSVDDIGKRNDYIRAGSKWKDVEAGIQWAVDAREKFGIELRCTRTTQFLNLLSTQSVIQYFNRLDIPTDILESFVYNPWELCVAHAPQEIKDQCDVHHDIVKHEGSIEKLNIGLAYYLALDRKRGTNILDAFPEYEKYVQDLKMDVFFRSG
jgi:organic radical activating enzyme